MHLARRGWLVSLAALSALTFVWSVAESSDRTPLVGTAPTVGRNSLVTPSTGGIVSISPSLVPCDQVANFSDVDGGESPGTNYDGLVFSGGLQFAERFQGQTLGYAGDFDVVIGAPSNPLVLQTGAAGQNLDVFAYSGNVLTGLGPLGYPDLDAIGEGAIAISFPIPQERVSLQIVGGNGGTSTLSFYRTDGSLIDNVVISGLADDSYGFRTADATLSIAGILIQNTDASGIGVTNICHAGNLVSSSPVTWGRIKTRYR